MIRCFLILSALAVPMAAQNFGEITGTVSDSTGVGDRRGRINCHPHVD